MDLDVRDTKLLKLISRNGHVKFSEAAKQLKTSKQVIQYRLKRLEERGFIKQYLMIINPSALGFQVFSLFFQLQNTDKKIGRQLIDQLVAHPSVTWVARCGGGYDLVCAIYEKNIFTFNQVMKSIVKQFAPYIKKVTTNISIEEQPLQGVLRGKDEEVPLVKTSQEYENPYKIDKIETALLTRMSNDARATLVTLAKDLKSTVDVVRHRIKKLRAAGVIQGYATDVDISKLGLSEYHVLMQLRLGNEKRLTTFYSYLANHPNIAFLIQCIGEWNYTITINAHNNKEFNEIMLELKEHFADLILSYDSLMIFDEFKYTFLPPLNEKSPPKL